MPDEVTRDDEVYHLQTELLRLLRSAQAAVEASRIRGPGLPDNTLRGPVLPEGEVLRIRRRIRQLNPDAALYEFWGGAMPDPEN